MHTCTMHALWAKAYHLLVCECVRRPVFVCAWHLTTIHRSICCGSFHRLGLLSDGGSDAGLISCSLTAPACSWVEPARSCGNFSSSVATFFFQKNSWGTKGKGHICSIMIFLFLEQNQISLCNTSFKVAHAQSKSFKSCMALLISLPGWRHTDLFLLV